MAREVTDRPRKRVLVVDDNALIRGTTARVLRHSYDVVECQDYQSVAALLAEGVDLYATLSDFDLGDGANGLEVLRAVQTACPHCIRILASAREDDSVVHDPVVQRRLLKPWAIDELMRVLGDEAPLPGVG